MSRLKQDRQFLIIMIMLALVEGLRFFDHTLHFHSAPMGIMQNYRFAELTLLIFFICTILFFGFCLKKISNTQKTTCYLLLALLSVFLFPMYFNENYFGTMDVYAWCFLFISIFCIMQEKGMIFVPVLSFLSGAICPMSIFTTNLMLLETCLIVGRQKENRWRFVGMVSYICAGIGGALNYQFGVFQTDAIYAFTFRKFAVACILLIPYLIIAIRMFVKLIKSLKKNRTFYLISVILGLPGILVYLCLADYSRVVVYGFVYFILLILSFLLEGDKKVEKVVEESIVILGDGVGRAVFVAYPFLIMTFWISGPLTLFEETFVAL